MSTFRTQPPAKGKGQSPSVLSLVARQITINIQTHINSQTFCSSLQLNTLLYIVQCLTTLSNTTFDATFDIFKPPIAFEVEHVPI
jgi:hypothetical protein